MLAGDESVLEPWLLGWCWVVVRAGGGADSMPYCSVGECKCDLEPALVPRPFARATLICRMAA
jgi:hypothetical protein